MNSDFYQNQIKKEQFKKIVDAFNVESQSFTDIDFGDDIAIRPNFTISSILKKAVIVRSVRCHTKALLLKQKATERFYW